MPTEPEPNSFEAWRAKVAELAASLYGQTIDGLEEELAAGYAVGDTPAEFCAGVFTN
jgi:hypothetical protein